MMHDMLSKLTAMHGHLLLVAPDHAGVDRLNAAAAGPEWPVGIISDDFPLLVNLTLLENITLAAMYHQSRSLQSCLEDITPWLDSLEMHAVMDQRPQFLSRPLRLKAYLLRALLNGSTFLLLPLLSRTDCDVLHRAVQRADLPVFLWACCLSNEVDVYTSLEYPLIRLYSPQ
jgi:ABC-type Na+ transport system ATPase subunit NatA